MSKAVPTRQVTVHCDVSEAQAWEWNINAGRQDSDKYKRYSRVDVERLISFDRIIIIFLVLIN